MFKTNIGNSSVHDSKSIVNIISINVRFSWLANGRVLKHEKQKQVVQFN